MPAPSARCCRRQRRQGHGAERHEEEAETDALDHPDDDDRRLRNVRRPAGHRIERPGREPEADAEKDARIDPPDQLSDDHHGAHRADAPRPQDEAGADDRVIHEILTDRGAAAPARRNR